MTDRKMLIRLALVACFALVAVNCSGGDDAAKGIEDAAEDMKKAGEDLAGEVENVVDEATDGAAGAIESTIDGIKAAIEEKEGALEAVKAKISEMSPTDLMGENGSALKAESETLMNELSELKQKLEEAMGS